MTIFAQEKKTESLVGKWGDERRKNLTVMRDEVKRAYFTSEHQGRYSHAPLDTLREMTSSPMNKYKSLQRSGFSLSSLQTPQQPVETTRQTTSGGMMSRSGHLSPPRTTSPTSSTNNMRGSLNNDHRAMTAQAGPARSIYKETFVNHFIPPEVLEESERNNLHRSNSRNMHSSNAPPAQGRSGLRKERGCMTSGLSGERLNTAPEPSINSFAQRSWLYSDDPALKIKLQGRPPVPRIMDRSLILPAENEELQEEEKRLTQRRLMGTLSSSKSALNDESLLRDLEENEKLQHKQFGRHYVYTGDVISKTGARRYGVFLDDHDEEVLKSVPVFRR